MKKFLKTTRVILLITGFVLVVKSAFLINLYFDIERLLEERVLIEGYSDFEDVVTYTLYDYYYDELNFRREVPEETHMRGGFVVTELIILLSILATLAAQFIVLTKALQKKDYLFDLLPFKADWLSSVNLGVRRILGIITSSIFYPSIAGLIIYPISLIIATPIDDDYYDNMYKLYVAFPGLAMLIYFVIWLIFFVFMWLFLGFTHKSQKIES